jgi:hypothetical protein
MENKITQAVVDQYVKARGEMCPKCKSPEVDVDSMLLYDEETGKVYQDKMCLTCMLEWTDVFVLEGIKQVTMN